jgi:spore coat polysaccharide biosynthesis protein SpsF
MKKAIFVTVRTGSTRLKNKALVEINGVPVITRIIRRVKRSKKVDGVILCTTEREQDDVLVKIAQEEGIEYFRGSEKDKLERWNGAAQKFGIEFFVTADGDDVFCDPELIDLAFEQYERNNADFIDWNYKLICGSFTYGIKASALKKVCEIKDSKDTEMMWVYFTDTGLFKCEEPENFDDVFKKPELRMTLDYPDDLKFFEAVINHFEVDLGKEYYSLREIVAYLDEHPEVVKINQYLMQEFLDNQKRLTTLKLKNNKE